MSWHQTRIPISILRGGTSRGVFFHEKDIPKPGALRDRVLKRVMGTPDSSQIDGLGGAHTVTSKIAIVKQSARADADVDYTFAQVGTGDDTIEYKANCGNVSAAVGPFAIDEGLVKKFVAGLPVDGGIGGPTQLVRIFNTGTQKLMYEHVPIVVEGQSKFAGEFEIAGVPGSGAPVLIDWKETVGAGVNRGLLPTGNAIDVINVQGKDVRVTICDVANLSVFVKASDLGIRGDESKAEIDGNAELGQKLRELRSKTSQKLGLVDDWRSLVDTTPFTPFIILVSEPPSGSNADLQARMVLRNSCHPTLAGSGTICTGACSQIPGSIVNEVLLSGSSPNSSRTSSDAKTGQPLRGPSDGSSADHSDKMDDKKIHILHPKGLIPVHVDAQVEKSPGETSFNVLAISRTFRRILDGYVYVPHDVWRPGQEA